MHERNLPQRGGLKPICPAWKIANDRWDFGGFGLLRKKDTRSFETMRFLLLLLLLLLSTPGFSAKQDLKQLGMSMQFFFQPTKSHPQRRVFCWLPTSSDRLRMTLRTTWMKPSYYRRSCWGAILSTVRQSEKKQAAYCLGVLLIYC